MLFCAHSAFLKKNDIMDKISMFIHENEYLEILKSQKYINNTVSLLVPQNDG
jgi:hypothetical protein